jgi:hypothetical protein
MRRLSAVRVSQLSARSLLPSPADILDHFGGRVRDRRKPVSAFTVPA